MKPWLKWFIAFDSLLVIAFLVVIFVPVGESRPPLEQVANVANGKVLLNTAGCYACHTDVENDGLAFAGGPKLDSPFGDFYAPNISSSERYGIGGWNITDFEAALRQGRSPEGHAYYPAFPFLSYRSLTDQDVVDLFAALQATDSVEQASKPHDLPFPFNVRLGLKPWRWLFASTQSLNFDQSTELGRGRYLIDAVAHCGECHNPRNAVGAFMPPYLGGNREIPGGVAAPAITGEALARMDWTEDDLYYFLADGMLPDGDFVGGSMVEVIEHGTSLMTDADRAAMAKFLFSLQR